MPFGSLRLRSILRLAQPRPDGVPDANGIHEPQSVQAIVGQYRSWRGGDEQARGRGQHEVAVSDTLAELRVAGGDLVEVEVHVEVVARNAAEVSDVRLGDGSAVGKQRVADLQVLEVLAERVLAVFATLAPRR